MRNLINFFARNSSLFLFLGLVAFSLILISNNKGYQRSVILSSTNGVTGWMCDKSSNISDFFHLKEVNQSLSDENAELRNRIVYLESLLNYQKDSIQSFRWNADARISPEKDYRYLSAKVIRNTTQFQQNYLTLNKGSNDGVRPNMGVISNGAVVGIVEMVSPKFSKVISLLHPISSINTKFKSNNYFGSLEWDGKDYRYAKLNDIARHVKFSLGDTLITSGFVKTFPEGMIVGTVDDFQLESNDPYYNIEVALGVDFRTLSYVQIVNYLNYDEQEALEHSEYGDTLKIESRQ